MKSIILFLIIFFQVSYVFSTITSSTVSTDPCPRFGRRSAPSGIIRDFVSIRRHEQQSSCNEYNIGEQRVFDDERLKTPGGYGIKKNPDGSYTASLVLLFAAADDYDFSPIVPHHRVHDHYMRRVKSCMKEVNPYMLGPSGEKLTIEILDYNKIRRSNSKPPDGLALHRITIQSSRGRSHSGSYEADIDCQVITHEILHLLGLKDEYPEMHAGHFANPLSGHIRESNPSALRYRFDCRVAQRNSIMSFHQERFQSISNGINASLLDPIHFDAILYGHCDSREDLKMFRQCSELAYQNSRYHRDCHVSKRRCEALDLLGRERQGENQNDDGQQNDEQDQQNNDSDLDQNQNDDGQDGLIDDGTTKRPFAALLVSLNLTEAEERMLPNQIKNLTPQEAQQFIQFLERMKQPPPNLSAENKQKWTENINRRIRQIERRNGSQSEDQQQDTEQQQDNDLGQNQDIGGGSGNNGNNEEVQRPFIELSTSLNLTPAEERAFTNQVNSLTPQQVEQAIQFLEMMRSPPSNLNAERKQRWTENISKRIRQIRERQRTSQ